jgi:hypothetical protein
VEGFWAGLVRGSRTQHIWLAWMCRPNSSVLGSVTVFLNEQTNLAYNVVIVKCTSWPMGKKSVKARSVMTDSTLPIRSPRSGPWHGASHRLFLVVSPALPRGQSSSGVALTGQ